MPPVRPDAPGGRFYSRIANSEKRAAEQPAGRLPRDRFTPPRQARSWLSSLHAPSPRCPRLVTHGRWNVLLTVVPGPHRVGGVLGAMDRFGHFRGTWFRDVCVGWVDDVAGMLEQVHVAREAGQPWASWIARILPLETVFGFTPDTLADRLEATVTPFADRLPAGATFCVRAERRGLSGEIHSRDIEQTIADRLMGLAAAAGRRLAVDFADPDFVAVAETVGTECGVALLDREVRQRYPFVRVP